MRVEGASSGLLRPDADFSDLTASVRTGSATWDDDALCIPFDPEPSPAEQVLIRRRLMTRDNAHEAWVAAVVAARDADPPDFEALTLLHTEAALRGIDAP